MARKNTPSNHKWSKCVRKKSIGDALECRPADKGEVVPHINPARSHIARAGEIVVRNIKTGYSWAVNQTTFDRFYQLIT